MLRKLMKHEFRATGRVLLPLLGILLLAALAARFSLGFLLETDSWFLNLVGGLLTAAFGLAIFAVCLMALITMVNRFRTNLLGDEGYIMFTLPASVHQQIWSKLIVSAVWFIATGLAVVAASFILVAQQGFWQDIRWGIRQMFQGLTAYYAFNGTAFLLELLGLIFVACCALCLEFYAAMAIGHSFNDHKGLLSVVSFFVLSAAMTMLAVVSASITGNSGLFDLVGNIDTLDISAATHVVMLIFIAIEMVKAALYYIPTTLCLKKWLNLA